MKNRQNYYRQYTKEKVKNYNMKIFEIEKKFLITEIPLDLSDFTFDRIIQGYILTTSDGSEVRIRIKGDEFFLTAKSGGGLKRVEAEIKLAKEQFDKLWLFTEGSRINKKRYSIKYGNYVIELDLYEEKLKGLIVAEVEFENEDDASSFNPPAWFGRDVTEDYRYKNRNLALYGLQSEI